MDWNIKGKALKELNNCIKKLNKSIKLARKRDRNSFYRCDWEDEQFQKWEAILIEDKKATQYMKRLVVADLKKKGDWDILYANNNSKTKG